MAMRKLAKVALVTFRRLTWVVHNLKQFVASDARTKAWEQVGGTVNKGRR